MIPVRYQADGTTSPTLLRGGGRRTQCSSGGRTSASVTAPLSRQIHDLEDEVGTKLFVRSKSGMRLPPVNRGPLEVKTIETSRPKETSWKAELSTRPERKTRTARKKLCTLRLRRCSSSEMVEDAAPQAGTAPDLKADVQIEATQAPE
jgi:hypothetical protein